jgi:hypothetical protein
MLGAFGERPDTPFPWSGWLGIAFFGPAALILMNRLRDRRPQIVADERGLYWRQWSEEIIPWREFSGVTVHQVSGQRLLGLTLRNRAAYPATTRLGQLARYNAELGFSDVTLSAQGLDRSFEDLRNAVSQFVAQGRA